MAISEFSRDLELVETSFDELKLSRAGRSAKADGLSFKDTKNTEWWTFELDGEQVGCGGLIRANPKAYRVKSTFILPEWRRQGFYTTSIWLRMIKAYELGAEWVEGIARSTSGAGLKKMGFSHEEGRAFNFLHINVQELFKEADFETNPVDLLLELCPKVEDGS